MTFRVIAALVVFFFIFGYRVITHASPGMASAYSAQAKPGAFDWTPFFNGLDHVVAAGGVVTAVFSQ